MKKRYVFGFIALLIVGYFLITLIIDADKQKSAKYPLSHVGEKTWNYNFKDNNWSKYDKNFDSDLENNAVFSTKMPEDNSNISTYSITSDHELIGKNLELGENSVEFIDNNKLYSYYPSNFNYSSINYNGISFGTTLLKKDVPNNIKQKYQIILMSDFKNNEYNLQWKENKNKYVIVNDIGKNFYKYYIIPNYNDKLKIGEFSNEFEILDNVEIKLQRIDGCSKKYPCYTIKAKQN